MTRDELILQVAARMDEITPSAGLSVTVDGADGNPLYELILKLIDDGVLELFSAAPYWRLGQTAFDPTTEIVLDLVDSRKVLRLKLNDNFLRVAEINCSYFQRPITQVFPEQSTEGRRQHNRFLRGREAKPVGVISHGVWSSGGATVQCREIDCYSLPADATLAGAGVVATYIAKPATAVTTSTTTVPVPDVLLPALEWLLASRAFGARGDANHAAICQQNAQNLLV